MQIEDKTNVVFLRDVYADRQEDSDDADRLALKTNVVFLAICTRTKTRFDRVTELGVVGENGEELLWFSYNSALPIPPAAIEKLYPVVRKKEVVTSTTGSMKYFKPPKNLSVLAQAQHLRKTYFGLIDA